MLKYFNPLAWGRWIGQLVYGWALSISWRDAPKAIPALLLVFVLSITSVIALSDSSDWRSRLISNQLSAAWERDDFDTAELIIRRKLARKPDDTKAIYQLAVTLDAQKDHDRALELMRRLVTFNGDVDAARWVVQKEYYGKKWAKLDAEQRVEFGKLLARIYREEKDDLAISNLYADYLMAAERFADAVPVLDDLSRGQPMRGLQAAAISRSLSNEADAEIFAERCLEKVSKMSEEDPANSTLALSVAQNQLFLQRYSEAIDTLNRAVPRAKTDAERQQLHQALGDGVVAWVGYIESTPIESLRERLRVLQLLQMAVMVAPNNPRVMAMVADHVLATADETNEEVSAVREALIAGSSPAIAHFIQGTAALVKDDVESATMHLKFAAELMPNSGAIMNNLAVALTSRGDENLEQAFKFANAAVENTRDAAPHFYETRGQILFRLKRYLEAVPDLERALAHPDLASKAHESLAACYAELGEEELSELHREAAEGTAKSPRRQGDSDSPDLTAR
jgi:Flp pilus assembly protein TadD